MTSMHVSEDQTNSVPFTGEDGIDLLDVATILASHWRLLVVGPITVGILTLGATFLIAPIFTAKTTFLPPQQQQGVAASTLASLGSLAGLAGGAGIKTPGDQYVALMQSVNVEDRIVDKFKLMETYETKYRFQARKVLEQNVRITLGKKDGLISVEADALDPAVAADIANQYVVELRRLSSELALTEAKQRRIFFEAELKRAHVKLADAQQVLQNSGFNAGALKAEPKAAAEGYARIQAEITAAEVRLQTMRRSLADAAPEVQRQLAQLGALKAQQLKLEGSAGATDGAGYISHYREYKYQEALFELLSRQYESARLDESREGALIQVVDAASPAEYKSRPKRAFIAIATTFGVFLLLLTSVFVRYFWQQGKADSVREDKLARLRRAWRA